MSVPDSNPLFKCKSFYPIIEDDLDRIFDIVGKAEFTFYVQGSCVESTIAAAFLI
jgi:hypothetical protein